MVRGDWFVTSGSSLEAVVVVTDASGGEVYREGPTRASSRAEGDGGGGDDDQEPASEGNFRFYCEVAGALRVVVTNPSDSESRTVTLAWLKGRDDDDPFTASPDEGWDIAEDDPHGDALIANPRNASAFAQRMLGRASSLHKAIDGLVSQQAYMSVLHRRHAGTLASLHGRVVRFSLAEAAAILVCTLGQVALIRRFQFSVGGKNGGGGFLPSHAYANVV